MERSGRMLKDLLSCSNLFSGEGCGREKCGACESASKPLNCSRRGLVYETSCEECMVEGEPGAMYVGETARSSAERMGEHLADANCGRKDSHNYNVSSL